MRAEIIGHKRQRERLKTLWQKNKLPSTLMFAGESGIGKSLVAAELFRTLLCEGSPVYGGCGECRTCRLFDSGNHPDYYLRDCLNKEEAAMESLRELLYSLHLSSYSGSRRIVLLNNSEHLSIPGANLLLKVLEEPRPDTHFCLLCSNPSRLPATLLSRCHIWFFDKLSDAEIAEIIRSRGTAENFSPEEIAVIADGTMENIAGIEQHCDGWRALTARLDKIAAGDPAEAGEFAYELAKDRDVLRERLRLLRIHARQRMLASENSAERVAWSFCLTNLLDAEYLLFERNIGAAYVLSIIFLDLADTRSKSSQPLSLRGRSIDEMVV